MDSNVSRTKARINMCKINLVKKNKKKTGTDNKKQTNRETTGVLHRNGL